MTTYSNISGLPLPENTDILDANGTFGGYANGLDTQLAPKFTTDKFRTYPGGVTSSPPRAVQQGMVSVLTGAASLDKTVIQVYDSGWREAEQDYLVYKAADTARASTIVLAADPHLVVDLPVGEYHIDAFLAAANPVAGVDLRAQFVITGTGAYNMSARIVESLPLGTTAVTQTNKAFYNSSEVTVLGSVALSNGGDIPAWKREIVRITVSSGVITAAIHWCQNVSNASPTTMLAGSFLIIR